MNPVIEIALGILLADLAKWLLRLLLVSIPRRHRALPAATSLDAVAAGFGLERHTDDEDLRRRIVNELHREFDFHGKHAKRLVLALDSGLITRAHFDLLRPPHIPESALRAAAEADRT
jgi:hypothetical protein